MFYKEARGRNYFRTGQRRGRYLSAGFHNVMGYFRDDQPLYELLLDEQAAGDLDEMWREMDFVASDNIRTYVEFAKLGTRGTRDDFKDGEPRFAEIEVEEIIVGSEDQETRGRLPGNGQGRQRRGDPGDQGFFTGPTRASAGSKQARRDAEPSHLKSLFDFAARAYRRPLSPADRDDLLSFYREARERYGLDHEAAMREAIVLVLMSPEFSYRIDLVEARGGIQPLSDFDLASRLSYFLWSSMPDEELLRHAAAGDLHEPEVIAAQARRMLQDPRTRALAVEFGGNWLDFRDFEEIGTVDRERFPAFTDELREAMFEEPVRFLLDVFRHNRSILDFLYANDTFVNPVLARHYGMPPGGGDESEWVRVADADRYDRGGLLPMAAFLTKNAPGLRTSPVKRGNWVVKNFWANTSRRRRRWFPSCRPMRPRWICRCAKCWRGIGPTRIAPPVTRDSIRSDWCSKPSIRSAGRRTHDLGGRPVDARATFPGGIEGEGLQGMRQYIRDHRENDFVRQLLRQTVGLCLGTQPGALRRAADSGDAQQACGRRLSL